MNAKSSVILNGKGLGLAATRGEVYRVQQASLPPLAKSSGDVEFEQKALESAIAEVALELRQGYGEDNSKEILLALEQMLLDPELLRVAAERIADGWGAAAAIQLAADSFAELFADDEFLVERAHDLIGLSQRVARKILKLDPAGSFPTDSKLVLVAKDLTPDQIMSFPSNVVGVVLSAGSATSHSAIMLRSNALPAVINCVDAELLKDGELVLVDPVGNRVVRGGDNDMATKAFSFITKNLEPLIPVRANIGSVQEAFIAGTSAADGVGLVRTEFLYFGQKSSPTLEQQAQVFEQLLRAAPEGPVLIRTIDVAGDKEVPFLTLPQQSVSEAAVAGYRVLSHYPEFVSEQLQAIELARQRVGREVSVMPPMISDPEQLAEFVELARKLGDFHIGVMLETPNILPSIPDIAGMLDFASVGTNDLSQFLFSADRYDPKNAEQLNYWQPSFISALSQIANSARSGGLAAGVCGESAADPEFALVLAGLGFESISVSVGSLASVRSALSSASLSQAESLAQLALAATSAPEAQAIVRSELNRLGLES